MIEKGRPVPKRLRKEPLIEAVWEVRFSSDKESVAELLPGLIYQAMGKSFPKTERLPASNLPRAVLLQDATLRYVPTVRLEDPPYSIQIGEHVVSLSCPRPYTGWGEFESKIIQLTKKLKTTNLLTRLERFSLKYIDVIPLDEMPSLKPLQVKVKLGNHELTTNPIQLRTELFENGFRHIIQIASPAQAVLTSGERFEGLLIDIDTIYQQETDEFWGDFRQLLNRAHLLNKNLFFHILTQETEIQLEPEY
ncbi:MAG: TIGR04255 family protein [Syntrophales bacterium]|nr:TIGR04255 family protein [Syntrophales bacterium]MDD5643080.1 TIGR04255 family protein [Syntrophales bacterium]